MMSDTLDPKDLLRYQTAQREAQQAQQRAVEAQQAHIAAVGAAQFVSREIATTYGVQQGDTLNIETGDITRAPKAAAPVPRKGKA